MAVNNIVVTIIALSGVIKRSRDSIGDIRAGPFEVPVSLLVNLQLCHMYTRAQRALWLVLCLLFFFKSLDRLMAVDPMTDASPFAPGV